MVMASLLGDDQSMSCSPDAAIPEAATCPRLRRRPAKPVKTAAPPIAATAAFAPLGTPPPAICFCCSCSAACRASCASCAALNLLNFFFMSSLLASAGA